MKIGYARVSTDDQNPDLQLAALRAAGCEKIFTDKATGANVKRLKVGEVLKGSCAGDTLIVWKLDRLGRGCHDLIGCLDGLKARGWFLRHHRHHHADRPRHVANGGHSGGTGTLADWERTKAGRAAAMARGVKMGRKVKLTTQQADHARKLIGQGEHTTTRTR